MSSSVEVVVLDHVGDRPVILENTLRVEYARAVGYPGGFKVTLPQDAYDPTLFAIDSRVEFWRSLPGGRKILDTDSPFFIRRRRRRRGPDGSATFEFLGPSAVELCARRIVAYPAASGQAVSNGPIDDILKVVMRENFSSDATNANRQIAAEFLTIEANQSLGPTVRVRYARRNVLDLFRDLMAGSMSVGEPVFFDVIRRDRVGLSFRTYIGQRGSDHGPGSSSPIVFSAAAGNLAEDAYDEDYEDEINVGYAGGSGEEADRLERAYKDATRELRSVWGRREAWVDARDSSDADALLQDATNVVLEGRPRNTISGTLISTEGTRYGIDWGFGDRVVAESFGVTTEAWANAIAVTIDERGEETITSKVEGVEVSA